MCVYVINVILRIFIKRNMLWRFQGKLFFSLDIFIKYLMNIFLLNTLIYIYDYILHLMQICNMFPIIILVIKRCILIVINV